MVRAIEFDVNFALWDEAVLEAGNQVVSSLKNKNIEGAAAFNVIHQGLSADLSVTLARLFDFGSRRFAPNKRETSSIPLLIRLLKQKRCRDHFIARAGNWVSAYRHSDSDAIACDTAIKSSIEDYNALMRGGGPSALSRLQKARNYRIAHRKINDVEEGFPRYRDLFMLVAMAAKISENIKFATSGHNSSLAEQKMTMDKEALAFWSRALHQISN